MQGCVCGARCVRQACCAVHMKGTSAGCCTGSASGSVQQTAPHPTAMPASSVGQRYWYCYRHCCCSPYSTFCVRGSTTVGWPVGSSADRYCVSLVTAEPDKAAYGTKHRQLGAKTAAEPTGQQHASKAGHPLAGRLSSAHAHMHSALWFSMCITQQKADAKARCACSATQCTSAAWPGWCLTAVYVDEAVTVAPADANIERLPAQQE